MTTHTPGDPHTMSPERLAEIRKYFAILRAAGPWETSTLSRALGLLAEVDHHLADERARGRAEVWRHDAAERLVYALISRDEAARFSITGPHTHPGFQGCTNHNPDHCACANDEDLACDACNETIEADEPYYGLTVLDFPWLSPTDRDQSYTELSWHVRCDGRAASAAERGDA